MDLEVWDFRKILRFFLEHTGTDRSAGSETEHVIRILKIYGFANDQDAEEE